MTTYVLCQHAWQVDMLKDKGEQGELRFVALTSEAAYALKIQGLKFVEPLDYSIHAISWGQYTERTSAVRALSERLDIILKEGDPFFQAENIKIFHYLGYLLKICLDQMVFYADVIDALRRENPAAKFICADTGPIEVDEFSLFTPQSSLIKYILEQLSAKEGLVFSTQNKRLLSSQKGTLSFGQPKQAIKHFLSGNLLGSIYDFVCTIKNRSKSGSIMSLACKELTALCKDSPEWQASSVPFAPIMQLSRDHTPWRHAQTFLKRVEEDHTIRSILQSRSIDLYHPMHISIAFLAHNIEYIKSCIKRIARVIDRLSPKLVISQSMAPLYLAPPLAKEICDKRDIPFACWMHGGYGATYSLAGYDVTDIRDTSNHITYGPAIETLLHSQSCVIKQLGIPTPSRIACGGSPHFKNIYSGWRKSLNKKKKIVFCLGIQYHHNQFYFGYNRNGAENNIWSENYAIVQVLAEFQNHYDIVIKDYPNSIDASMWPKILNHLGATEIKYVTNQESFESYAKSANTLIFPWISTTFFQTLFIDVDRLILETGDVSQNSRSILEKYTLFSDNIFDFCNKLRHYLANDAPLSRNKNALKEFYMNNRHAKTPQQLIDFFSSDRQGE